MKHRFLSLCAVMVGSVALTPVMSSVAQANPEADLSVIATSVGKGVPKVAVGETVTYDITLTNLGPDTASKTLLRESNPDQFNLVSLTCSDASFCEGEGADLAPGATVTATIVDVVCCFPQGADRKVSAGAGATTTTHDPDLANNTANVATKIIGPHGFSFPG